MIPETMKKHFEKIQMYMRMFTQHDYQDSEVGKILDRLYDPSGKMIRAQLVILCGNICQKLNRSHTEEDPERLYRMAALVELTHYTSLIHDDVIDDSPMRRNKPSIQSTYGKNAAVLSGDILLSRIYHQLVAEEIDEISLMMTKLLEEMCVGEIIQDNRRYNPDSGMEDYLAAIEGKTARLFATACKIGCICENTDDDIKNIFAELGEKIGYMFQIRDDYLDFMSDTKQEGKITGKDLFDGIYTYPLLAAIENPEARQQFENFLKNTADGTINSQDFEDIKQMIDEYDGFEKTKEYISQQADKCYGIISILEEKLNFKENSCPELQQLVEIIDNVRTI